jgi:hypothetical protein
MDETPRVYSHVRLVFNDGSSDDFVSPLSPEDVSAKLSWSASIPIADGRTDGWQAHFWASRSEIRSFRIDVCDAPKPEPTKRRTITPSKQEWAEHPDVQLLLMRRDRVVQLQRDIATAREIAEHRDANLEQRIDAMKAVSRLESTVALEIDAMDKKLNTLRAESNRHWQLVSKLLGDLAKLRQNDSQHQDRLKLARDKDAMKGLSAEEIEVIEQAKETRDDLEDE